MVQETRLDLIAAVAALVLGAASPGLAQPLTTLLNPPLARPDRLSAPDRLATPDQLSTQAPLTTVEPLMPLSPLAGPRPASTTGKPGDPCFQRPAGSLSAGGSGPGEYGRFMPTGGDPATASGSAPTAAQRAAANQPGIDRPLWRQDGSLMPGNSAVTPPTGIATAPPGAVPSAGAGVPLPPMDRPLWATGGPVKPCVTVGRPVPRPGQALPP